MCFFHPIVGIDVVVLTSGTVTLPAGGPASAAVPVTLVEDAIAEGDEFFLMRLSVNEGEGEIISGRGVANITVIDNDGMCTNLHVIQLKSN